MSNSKLTLSHYLCDGDPSGNSGMLCYNEMLLNGCTTSLCGSGGTGRHTILRGWRRKAWGFKSPLPHHKFLPSVVPIHRENSRKPKLYDLPCHHDSHTGLCLYYHCGPAAERQERRHLCRVWRTGEPDGIRTSGRGQCPLQSHNVVGRGLHDHFDYPGSLFQQTQRTVFRVAGD